MTPVEINRLQPHLRDYLSSFDDCFVRPQTRLHLPIYVEGQLADLPRKSVEPIALNANVPPRSLQEFLNLLKWDHFKMRNRLQEIVAKEHPGPHTIGLIDDTGCPKKGDHTPGVQRQYCGATGKLDNCVVTVHLGLSDDDFHCLVDSELFLPESWSEDRARCEGAGIPETMVHRPKWQIALELMDRAETNGIHFAWMTFDEGYGGKPGFLETLIEKGQPFVAEIPKNLMGWTKPQPVVRSRPGIKLGRPKKHPRLRSDARPSREASNCFTNDEGSQRFHVKDGQKGPMIWEAEMIPFFPQGPDKLPLAKCRLIKAQSIFEPRETKYFLVYSAKPVSLREALFVAFSRWKVERCFEDEKTELGLDHFEGRKYIGLIRHQILTAVSHLFLARERDDLKKKKSGDHYLPSAHRHGRSGSIMVVASASG